MMYSSPIRRAMQMCLKLLHFRCILALKRLFSSFLRRYVLAKYDSNKTDSLTKSDMELLSDELKNLLQSN